MDMLIDSATGHAMFSFMDVFSSYNQIKMSSKDTAKTAFQTPIGNFYYTAMPFGLKNAEDTYKKGHDRNLSWHDAQKNWRLCGWHCCEVKDKKW